MLQITSVEKQICASFDGIIDHEHLIHIWSMWDLLEFIFDTALSYSDQLVSARMLSS